MKQEFDIKKHSLTIVYDKDDEFQLAVGDKLLFPDNFISHLSDVDLSGESEVIDMSIIDDHLRITISIKNGQICGVPLEFVRVMRLAWLNHPSRA